MLSLCDDSEQLNHVKGSLPFATCVAWFKLRGGSTGQIMSNRLLLGPAEAVLPCPPSAERSALCAGAYAYNISLAHPRHAWMVVLMEDNRALFPAEYGDATQMVVQPFAGVRCLAHTDMLRLFVMVLSRSLGERADCNTFCSTVLSSLAKSGGQLHWIGQRQGDEDVNEIRLPLGKLRTHERKTRVRVRRGRPRTGRSHCALGDRIRNTYFRVTY